MRVVSAHRVLPYPGEIESGDAVVSRFEDDRGVFAIVDGLGHGPVAALAARRAVEALDAAFGESDVTRVMLAMHAALAGTRGAAATVLVVEGDRVRACGVGNVALRSQRHDLPFVLSPGILGVSVRRYRALESRLREGQRIVLHSDGVASNLPLDDLARLSPDDTVDAIVRSHRKTTDDAAVLVLDVRR